MPGQIEFFGSLQSPYCYFALDRIEALARSHRIAVVTRPVLPGVLRSPDTFAGRAEMERTYFAHDVHRTAAFLGLPFSEADPSPVNWQPDAGWVAAPVQDRVLRLYAMLHAAHREGRAGTLYAALMRHIWSGIVRPWDTRTALCGVLRACGLPDALIDLPPELTPDAAAWLHENDRAMRAAGHWGVPLFTLAGEPFYGQDRIEQLAWRIETSG